MSNTNDKPVGPHSNMTDKPADGGKPAGATPTAPVEAKPTSDAAKPATGLPATGAAFITPPANGGKVENGNATAPQPPVKLATPATQTGDRGAPQPGKPVEPAKAPVDLTRQPGESKQAHKARKAAGLPYVPTAGGRSPATVKPAPVKPATPEVPPALGDDLSNVFGFNFKPWPTPKTMAGAVPPLNVAVLSDGTFADADKPSDWAGRLHNGKPVTVTSTVTMVDCLIAAGALGVTTRGATNRMLALACALRPDSARYSLKAWGAVFSYIQGGTGETVYNFVFSTEAPGRRKKYYDVVQGTGEGGGRSYGTKFTPTGFKLVQTAFAGVKRPLPKVWQING